MYVLIALVALHLAASIHDFRFHKIPNELVLGGTVSGLVLSFVYAGGTQALVQSLMGCALGLIIFLPLYALGKMGAGDVKLLAMSGAWLGPYGVVIAGFASIVAGGVMAILWLIHFNGLARTYDQLFLSFFSLSLKRRSIPAPTDTLSLPAEHRAIDAKMPFALAIGTGSIISYFLITSGAGL